MAANAGIIGNGKQCNGLMKYLSGAKETIIGHSIWLYS